MCLFKLRKKNISYSGMVFLISFILIPVRRVAFETFTQKCYEGDNTSNIYVITTSDLEVM